MIAPRLHCQDCGRLYWERQVSRDLTGLLRGPCGHPLHRAVYCTPAGTPLVPYSSTEVLAARPPIPAHLSERIRI